MNTTAHLNNKMDCYVCAHMPLSTHSSGLWPYNILTASQGGVCKLIGETCCTFIPDEYSTGSDIYEDLQNLTVLQRHVADHTP